MPFYDKEGKEVEGVLTSEEVDAKIEETKTALQKEQDETKGQEDEKIKKLEEDLKTANEALEASKNTGGGSGDGNDGDGDGDGDKNKDGNAALRKKFESAEKALEDERTANKERWDRSDSEKVESAIKIFAGEDEELAKKIKHHYDTSLSGVKALTADEISQKVKDAYKLAGGTVDAPNPLNAALQGGGRGLDASTENTGKDYTEKDIAVGKKLGITDADRDNYKNDPRAGFNK